MTQSNQQDSKAKKAIKAACKDGDIAKLVCTGFMNGVNVLINSAADAINNLTTTSFQQFLKNRSDFFDAYIQDTVQKDQLNYIGGKMTLTLDAKMDTVQLSADFYFQNPKNEQDIRKSSKHGQAPIQQFSDWETDPDACTLQKSGKLEFDINPPEIPE